MVVISNQPRATRPANLPDDSVNCTLLSQITIAKQRDLRDLLQTEVVLCVCFIAQLVEHRSGIRGSHGFESR